MNYQDFTKNINNQISLLPQERLLQLAFKICKELFFEYQTFSEKYEWGNADFLLDGINLCDKALNGESDLDNIRELIPKIDSVTPDMDDYNSDEKASYALNAAASVYETLEFLIDNDKNHVINIASYYTDTIDFKVQEDKDLTEDEIDKHPLMIKARQFLLEETK
jgi:uncharacterized protein YjaG (DUF416 family)